MHQETVADAAAAALSVKCAELWFLCEVQLDCHEFDSRSQHEVVGNYPDWEKILSLSIKNASSAIREANHGNK